MSAIVQTDAMLSRTLVTAMSLIEDARAVEHSGVSLHAHLLGTFEILARWGVAEVTQLGGLLHSIYSTQYYHNHLIQRRFRKRVSAQVGPHPERLAYFFGASAEYLAARYR